MDQISSLTKIAVQYNIILQKKKEKEIGTETGTEIETEIGTETEMIVNLVSMVIKADKNIISITSITSTDATNRGQAAVVTTLERTKNIVNTEEDIGTHDLDLIQNHLNVPKGI